MYTIYVTATVFTLLHCYVFQPSTGSLYGVLIYFVRKVNKICCCIVVI